MEDNEGDVDLSDGFAEVEDDDVMANISTEVSFKYVSFLFLP